MSRPRGLDFTGVRSWSHVYPAARVAPRCDRIFLTLEGGLSLPGKLRLGAWLGPVREVWRPRPGSPWIVRPQRAARLREELRLWLTAWVRRRNGFVKVRLI